MGRRLIAVLGLQFRVVDGVGGQPRYGAGLHPADIEALFLEPEGKAGGRGVSHPAGGKIFQTDMDQAVQEGAGGDHHGPDPDLLIERGSQADNPAVFDDQ